MQFKTDNTNGCDYIDNNKIILNTAIAVCASQMSKSQISPTFKLPKQNFPALKNFNLNVMFLYLTDQTANKRIFLTQKSKAFYLSFILASIYLLSITYNFATGGKKYHVFHNSIANLGSGIYLISYQFSWKIITINM